MIDRHWVVEDYPSIWCTYKFIIDLQVKKAYGLRLINTSVRQIGV